MATFGELRDLISADLGARSGNLLGTEIEDAINRAIADYENGRFLFNEGRSEFSTVALQAEYDLLAEAPLQLTIDQAQYLFADHLYRLQRQSYEWYVEALVNQTAQTGPSNFYTIYEQKIFLYPQPDQITTVTLSGVKRLADIPFDDDAETNAWTNDALQLIRARAKVDLFANRLYEPALAEGHEKLAQDYLKKLRGDRDALRVQGVTRPFRPF